MLEEAFFFTKPIYTLASTLHNLSAYDDATVPDASKWSFGIAVSDWNAQITHALFEACRDTLIKHGAQPDNIHVVQVPGSYELPLGARILYNRHAPHAVICLGCVIRGETSHHEYINHAVATGLLQMSLTLGKPFVFGVLTPDTMKQALDRAGGQYGNKGTEAAITAIRMVALQEGPSDHKKAIGFRS
jgi:6,7-dimethyl-8-ribityllumazine synthase